MTLQEQQRRRLVRLFIIANGLDTGEKVTRAALAEACECAERTITRDLEFLRDADVPVAYDPATRAYVLTAPMPFQTVCFGLSEVMALAVAQESLERGVPYADALRAALTRVTHRLPDRLKAALTSARQVVSFGPTVRRDYGAAPYEPLAAAARDRATVRVLYHNLSRGERTYRCIDPYGIAQRDGLLCLVGFCHNRLAVREFALDRIHDVRPTGATFTVPGDFDLDRYLHGAVGAWHGDPTTIVVRFDPHLAPYAQRHQWTFPCSVERGPDGSATLRGTVQGIEGIRTVLLSWGAGFEVLEPAALRDRLRQDGEAIAARHEAKDEGGRMKDEE